MVTWVIEHNSRVDVNNGEGGVDDVDHCRAAGGGGSGGGRQRWWPTTAYNVVVDNNEGTFRLGGQFTFGIIYIHTEAYTAFYVGI